MVPIHYPHKISNRETDSHETDNCKITIKANTFKSQKDPLKDKIVYASIDTKERKKESWNHEIDEDEEVITALCAIDAASTQAPFSPSDISRGRDASQ